MMINAECIKKDNVSDFTTILRWACFFIFAGRAWQHLLWDAPFRAIFWDQDWMQGPIEAITGMSWEHYASSIKVEGLVQGLIRATGWLYFLCAFASLCITPKFKVAGKILLIGAASLFFLAFLNCKEKFFQLGEFMEYGIQVMSPLLLYITLFTNVDRKKIVMLAKISVALTFTGHGLYAINYYPQPGTYIDMMINVVHFNEDQARNILKLLGAFDFIFSVLIFLPLTSSFALIYCTVWGLLTATARLAAGFDIQFPFDTFNQYGFEMTYRLSNFMIPLWVFYMREKRSGNFSDMTSSNGEVKLKCEMKKTSVNIY